MKSARLRVHHTIMLSSLLRGSRKAVLLRAGVMIAAIAFADWRIEGDIPLGFLYLFPMLIVGSALTRLQIAVIALVCTVLTEAFDNFPWFKNPGAGIPRDILIFSAFFGMGLFVYEVCRSRETASRHLKQIEAESSARREAQEQMKSLVESSPAAILVTNSEGIVLLANEAAHRLLAGKNQTLSGESIVSYFPSLLSAAQASNEQQSFRTVVELHGRRADGEVFLADVWFSTYRTSAGARLAAMIVDASEDLRAREEGGLHQLLAGSRILVSAVSHEIRNVCAAIAVVHENLVRYGVLAQNKDFEALQTLISALENIAATELRQPAAQAAPIDLASQLEELRIIVEPGLRAQDIETVWRIDPDLPPVWADRQTLMQVFLNLVKNSERAMSDSPERQLTVTAAAQHKIVSIEFRDTGPGILDPDALFRPFQPNAHATGLGLYLSRAFMRSLGGDLRYQAGERGATFVVQLARLPIANEKDIYEAGDPDFISRRSRAVSREPQPAASD